MHKPRDWPASAASTFPIKRCQPLPSSPLPPPVHLRRYQLSQPTQTFCVTCGHYDPQLRFRHAKVSAAS